MDKLDDGRCVVFVPGVPRALVGSLHIIVADRVQMLEMSIPAALDVIRGYPRSGLAVNLCLRGSDCLFTDDSSG